MELGFKINLDFLEDPKINLDFLEYGGNWLSNPNYHWMLVSSSLLSLIDPI